jgi:hypothetical protein
VRDPDNISGLIADTRYSTRIFRRVHAVILNGINRHKPKFPCSPKSKLESFSQHTLYNEIYFAFFPVICGKLHLISPPYYLSVVDDGRMLS